MRHLLRVTLGTVCLLLAVTSCGPEDHEPEDPLHIEIELPVVGECGSILKGPWVVTVRITRDGDIYVPGVGGTMSLVGLRDHLQDLHEERGAAAWTVDRDSRFELVIEADAVLPYGVVAYVMRIAREPTIGIRRVWMAVQLAGDEQPGAIVQTVPDHSLSGDWFSPHAESIGVFLEPGTRWPNLAELGGRIRALPEEIRRREPMDVRLKGDGAWRISYGTVMSIFDTLLQSGALHLVEVACSAPPVAGRTEDGPSALREVVARNPGVSTTQIVFRGEELRSTASHSVPSVGIRHTEPWGWSDMAYARVFPDPYFDWDLPSDDEANDLPWEESLKED